MNSETGQVYRGLELIESARLRGEPIVEISEDVADAVEIGMDKLYSVNRKERRKILAEARRNAKKRRQ